MVFHISPVQALHAVKKYVVCSCDSAGLAEDASGKDDCLFKIPLVLVYAFEFPVKSGNKVFPNLARLEFIFLVKK